MEDTRTKFGGSMTRGGPDGAKGMMQRRADVWQSKLEALERERKAATPVLSDCALNKCGDYNAASAVHPYNYQARKNETSRPAEPSLKMRGFLRRRGEEYMSKLKSMEDAKKRAIPVLEDTAMGKCQSMVSVPAAAWCPPREKVPILVDTGLPPRPIQEQPGRDEPSAITTDKDPFYNNYVRQQGDMLQPVAVAH